MTVHTKNKYNGFSKKNIINRYLFISIIWASGPTKKYSYYIEPSKYKMYIFFVEKLAGFEGKTNNIFL